MILQTLVKRYVKKQTLLQFLDDHFGNIGYEVEVIDLNLLQLVLRLAQGGRRSLVATS